jgi:hypothetical protein
MTTTTGTTTTKQKIVPMISSDCAGPLGLIHLPRLWSKLMIAAAGLLPEGYDECGPGFDQMTLNALNLDRQKTMDYVRANKPTYMQFEQWVIQQNGGSVSPEAIRKHNEAVRAYEHDAQLASGMRTSSGIQDATIADAVTLNKCEDLDELHRQLTGRA